MNNEPSVRVELHIGESTFARAVADVFEGDALTVTPIDGGPETVYPAGAWRHATVYDALGYPCAEHVAVTPSWTVTR